MSQPPYTGFVWFTEPKGTYLYEEQGFRGSFFLDADGPDSITTKGVVHNYRRCRDGAPEEGTGADWKLVNYVDGWKVFKKN